MDDRTYEWRNELEGVWLSVVRHWLVFQDECDLDDSGQTSSHQGISEESMDSSRNHQMLRVTTHSPSSHENDETRHKVPLSSSAISASHRKPHTQKSSSPPNNTHNRMLNIIRDPISTPPMLRECIDTAPRRNHRRVKELLGSSCSSQPFLPNEQHENHDNAVSDEGAAHDEVCETLAKVIVTAESERGNAAKEHLYPGGHWHELAQNRVSEPDRFSDTTMDAFLPMQLQVNSHNNLPNEAEHKPVCESCMCSRRELTAFMQVTEEVAKNRDYGADYLNWNVKARLHYSQDHAGWKDETKCCAHHEDVCP